MPAVSLLAASTYRRMPWLNGLGTTTEIAVEPLGTDRFRWRLSIADVARSGPFSRFDGYDRTIAVVAGAGMELAVAGRPTVRLDQQSDPYDFPGDAATDCTLIDGPIRDFNLITDRASAAGRVRALRGPAEARLDGGIALLHALQGPIEVAGAGGDWRVDAGDTLRLDEVEGSVTLTGAPGARALLALVGRR